MSRLLMLVLSHRMRSTEAERCSVGVQAVDHRERRDVQHGLDRLLEMKQLTHGVLFAVASRNF